MTSDTLIVVAALDEADRIAATLSALAVAFPGAPVFLADDGSSDATPELASAAGATVVRSERVIGKGQAMTAGVEAALSSVHFLDGTARACERARFHGDSEDSSVGPFVPSAGSRPTAPTPDQPPGLSGIEPVTDRPGSAPTVPTPNRMPGSAPTVPTPDGMPGSATTATDPIVVLCDGDLGESARELPLLADAIRRGDADLAVAAFATRVGGGFGLALAFARWAIRRRCGLFTRAPISGQRALRASVLAGVLPFAPGFGMEVGMTIDAVRAGHRLLEVDLDLAHRATGRTPAGFLHRARQLTDFIRVYFARAQLSQPNTLPQRQPLR